MKQSKLYTAKTTNITIIYQLIPKYRHLYTMNHKNVTYYFWL